jgi:hypothetical protein
MERSEIVKLSKLLSIPRAELIWYVTVFRVTPIVDGPDG